LYQDIIKQVINTIAEENEVSIKRLLNYSEFPNWCAKYDCIDLIYWLLDMEVDLN